MPFPSPGDIPDPGIKPMSSLLACGYFTTETPGKLSDIELPRGFIFASFFVFSALNMFNYFINFKTL